MSVVKKYEKLVKAKKPVKNTQRGPSLQEQQDYYHDLLKAGIARPDKYNIKPISSFL